MDFSPMPSTKKPPSQDAFQQALKARLHDQNEADATLTSQEIRQGVQYGRLQRLAERLALTQETLTRVLGISERTLQRRKEAGRLSPQESDRVERLLRVWRLALRAFDDETDEARAWLTTPKRALGDETPVEHLDTEPGARAVSEMLIVIDQTIPA